MTIKKFLWDVAAQVVAFLIAAPIVGIAIYIWWRYL